MQCPNGHELNQSIKLGTVNVERCSTCQGLWFDQNELRRAEDEQADFVQWLDADLWLNKDSFHGSTGTRLCPKDSSLMQIVEYGDSHISIDMCQTCHGAWLDSEEFNKISNWLQGHSSYELLHHYFQTLVKEGKQIFGGPEDLKSELHKFFVVVKYLQFRLGMGSPEATNILSYLPFTK